VTVDSRARPARRNETSFLVDRPVDRGAACSVVAGHPLGLDDAPLGLSAGFPDLALAGGGGDVVGLADTAWFDADATTPEFGTGGAVVIGRFSLDEATSLQLELTIEIVESTGAIRYETHALVVPPVIPAPGGAVVLAAMLIAGRGRRR